MTSKIPLSTEWLVFFFFFVIVSSACFNQGLSRSIFFSDVLEIFGRYILSLKILTNLSESILVTSSPHCRFCSFHQLIWLDTSKFTDSYSSFYQLYSSVLAFHLLPICVCSFMLPLLFLCHNRACSFLRCIAVIIAFTLYLILQLNSIQLK